MRIGILAAISEEVRPFDGRKDSGLELAGRPLYYIPHPIHHVILAIGGLGKVNSAVMSVLMIREQSVELIIVSGIAGALDPRLHQEQVFFGERLIQHDYGSKLDGEISVYPAGSVPLGSRKDPAIRIDPGISCLLRSKLPELKPAMILSGDVFLQCRKTRERLQREFKAELVDMESAAAAQAADLFRVPVLAVRAVSDLAGEKPGCIPPHQMKSAAKASARTVMKILDVFPPEITSVSQKK